MLYVLGPFTWIEPVAPDEDRPPVFAVIILAPELNVKEVLLVPVRTEVPISIVAPFATVNWIAQVGVVACEVMDAVGDILTACKPVPVKLKLTVDPDCVVVCLKVLVPDKVKFPFKFITEVVGVVPPLCKSKIPAAILKLPLIFNVPAYG